MRPMDAQNRLPEVATDQFALDQTLKHLRKLRWIGKEKRSKENYRRAGCQEAAEAAVQQTATRESFVSFADALSP
jgi:hypothetical protein